MTDSKAQATIELSRRSVEAPRDGVTGTPPLGRRVFSLRSVGSFLLALVVLYLVYRQRLGLDREEVWTNIQGAKVWLLALAFAIFFYCSFPVRALHWKVLRILIIEDGGKTGQMLERIRRRVTLGFVGIFALILMMVGTVLVTSFRHEVNAQQDELLVQKADAASTFMRDVLLPHDGKSNPGPLSGGPIQASTGSEIGVVALVPPASAGSDGTGRVLDSSSSASSFGLPFEEQAQKAAQEGATITETVQGPEGEAVRVVSVPVSGPAEEVGVVQAAQLRQVAWDAVWRLILVAVPVSLGGLLLAGIGGLYMSRRARQPVRDSFQRQRTFVADASHELKTPLALVKIRSEVLRRSVTDPENEEIVEDQLSEIDRMDALLSDLLALARLDAGRLEVEYKPFDLATVAAQTAGRFLTRAADEGVQLEVEVQTISQFMVTRTVPSRSWQCCWIMPYATPLKGGP